jgi:CBS domain-containing protein
MQIKDVMTRQIQIIDPDATIQEAAEKMEMYNIGALPVYAGAMPVGMVTDRDITVRATARGLDPSNTKVREVMTGNLITCREEEDAHEAGKRMVENKIRRILITDGQGFPLGICSVDDLAAHRNDPKNVERVIGEDSKAV